MKKLHLVANAHLDPVWMWSWDEGASMALATYYSAVELLGEYDYIFCHNEIALYEAVELHAPEMFEKIQEYAKDGKWHIMGGWYLQPDCNLPSGESFVRQIMGGREYFEEKFNTRSTTAVNFDSFGHSRGLVQILKKCGQDSYIFCRPMPELLDLPDNVFYWKGYDGSVVKAVRSRQAGLYATGLGKAGTALEKYAPDWQDKEAGLLLWGVGNHGGGPSRKDLTDLADLTIKKADEYQIVHSTPEAFFAETKPQVTYAKPLTPCFVKGYSSLSSIKQKHIELENKLYATEKICAIAEELCGVKYNFEKFDYAQKMLCYMEFHDVLSGTCGPDGEKDTLRKADKALETLDELFMNAYFELLKEETAAKEEEYPIVVFNPQPYDKETVVEVEFLVATAYLHEDLTEYIAVYQNGERIPAQIIKELTNINYERRNRVAFKCKLKGLDITRFDFKVEYVPKKQLPVIEDAFVYEDSVKRVVISKKTGLMTEYCVNGVNYLNGNAFEPYLYDDNADPWGWDMTSVGKNGRPFRLSDCKKGAFAKLKNVNVIEDGDVLTEVESFFEKGSSFVRVSYKIYKDMPYVDVKVDVLWNEQQKVLKLKLPIAVQGNFIAQTAFGTEKLTKDGAEQPMHRFVGMEKDGKCLAVYNDCIYGVSCRNNAIFLTLLNGSAYAAHPIGDRPLVDDNRFIPYIEQGRHSFSFRLAVDDVMSLDAKALDFAQKPYGLNVFPHGKGREKKSTLVLENKNISLHAFKRSKKGGYILRLFNNSKTPQTCMVEVFGCTKQVSFKKFEVKTLRFENGKIKELSLLEI